MQLQTLANKTAEINYRKKFSKQQLGQKIVEANEPTKKEFHSALSQKLKITHKLFQKLQKQKYTLSPYLEIGSEHAMRPALLDNKFGANGFATDISFYSLSHSKKFVKMFNFKKAPKTICADANNLPFKKDSFPFVFFYETLHHFPHPLPPLKEAYRVLAPGGICLVGSDPIKQSLQLNLWYRPNKLRSWEKLLKYSLILPFISHIGKTEVEKGILEGAFPLSIWKQSLNIFEDVKAVVKAFPLGPENEMRKSGHWSGPGAICSLALHLFGGGIQAVCQKKGMLKNIPQDIFSTLICPDCKLNYKVEKSLVRSGLDFVCRRCKTKYLSKNGVLVLLEKNLAKNVFSN